MTEPIQVVAQIPEAMSVMLLDEAAVEQRLTGSSDEALTLQKPAPNDAIKFFHRTDRRASIKQRPDGMAKALSDMIGSEWKESRNQRHEGRVSSMVHAEFDHESLFCFCRARASCCRL
jgi:hypothetical protein